MRIKYLALTVITLITCLSLSAQINQTDASGKKQGKWVKKYPSGNILYEGTFKDGKPVGEFKRYYDDATLQSLLVYNESDTHVKAQFFHPNGKKSAEGIYINKKKEGIWNYYSPETDGCKISEDNYVSDKKNGLSRKFYQTGEVAETLEFSNNVKNGMWHQYYADGKQSLKATYINGRLEGQILSFFPDGTLQLKGEYKNDTRNGKWEIFNEDGSLKEEIVYINGKPTDASIDEKETQFLDSLESNKGKLSDPDITGNELR